MLNFKRYGDAIVAPFRVVKGFLKRALLGRWDYRNKAQFPYGDETSYRRGIAYLDGHGTIEDWGCGTAYARRFVTKSDYVGIDGSPSRFADRVVDLATYESQPDCIFMRHVLEHNENWPGILHNAICSFNERMVLIIFTPFGERTKRINSRWAPIPDLSFRKGELVSHFSTLSYTEESLETVTEYQHEHIFYIKKR